MRAVFYSIIYEKIIFEAVGLVKFFYCLLKGISYFEKIAFEAIDLVKLFYCLLKGTSYFKKIIFEPH